MFSQPKDSPADERVIIVDDDNHEVDILPRSIMRMDNLNYRATYILVLNDAGQVFIQRRTMTKDMYPGYLDPVAGGVVTEGEDYETSARREVREELGIDCDHLDPLFDFFYQDTANKVFGRAYACRHNGPFKLQAEEIAEGFFCDIDHATGRLDAPLTPDGLYVLNRFKKEHAQRM